MLVDSEGNVWAAGANSYGQVRCVAFLSRSGFGAVADVGTSVGRRLVMKLQISRW